MRPLGTSGARFAGDCGEPDATIRARLREAADGEVTDPVDYARAVAALCGARLLFPIITTGPQMPRGPAGMTAVMITSPTGETGLPVFTGLDALAAWDPQARPVPCTLDEVAATAVDTGSAVVLVDLAGPSTLVLERPLVTELAAGRRLVELADGGFGWLAVVDNPAG